MFTLFEKDNSMLDIFGYRTTDERAQSSLKQISNGLVSVFLTFGEIPRVLYPKENEISRIVADTFCVQIEPLAKNFELWGSRRSKTTNVKPPLLIILDRSLDYAGPLLHPSTYQALIHDNFGITKNEVNIDGKMYDLDCDLDKFWNENRMEVFGTVAERIGQEVKGFINRYGAIEDDLSGAISNLPELSHQQLSLKSHTKIGDSLLNKIKARKADTLFKIEEDMISNAGVTLDKLIETLQSIPEKSDRLRCASIAFLCDVIPHNELQRVEEIVGESLEFLNNYFERSKIIQHQNKGYVGRLLNKVGEFGSQFDSSAVAEKLPIVEKVRKIIEESIEGYILRNPLTGKTEPSPIGSVFVFVIGPGSYVEYNGLQNLGKRNNLEITYGCTSLVRPDDFMEMMKKLGN
ncbi:sec1 family domain-containing protein 1 [Histomonas meleagridis]|uniref:sec1 family domain-containing protein 1 n=1 Tax=Histomonas meleagridis TaxID=135588 RepID=UPI00355A9A18|nr:sec1 family domain-containing protein 1 [Histomonas meleagridis]KAH0805930.1 sec1 family domain-containing protein 1 [Histomonas meleagridis]